MSDDGETERGPDQSPLLRLTADIVSAFVSRNPSPPEELIALINSVHSTLSSLSRSEVAAAAPAERPKPAVPISRSVQHDHIVCLEDGKKLKMLKRYLRTQYDMSPEDYRRRWGLPADYPMVAPAYAARRSDFARQIGLGKGVRKRG